MESSAPRDHAEDRAPAPWMNDHGKLRRCTDRDGQVVDFHLYLAAALVTLRMLIRRATKHYRWAGRPNPGA